MITELMLITMAVGAAIIFAVWISSRRKKRREQEQKEVADSTERFKKDLEGAANQIIGRMETQASQIETLLDDTSRSRTQLEGRIVELRKLLKKSEGQSTEIKDLLMKLEDAVEYISLLQKQMDAVELKIKAAQQAQLSQPQPQPVAQIPAPAPVPIQAPVQAQAPTENFAEVLEKSMAQETKPEKIPQPDESVNTEEIRQRLSQKPVPKPRELSADSAAIRDKLLSGKSVEEVSRETGLGRNAIELVQQMMRYQLERR